MQMMFIGLAMLVAAALGFWAVMAGGRWALRKWDTHQILSYARKVEREAKLREENARRYVMSDLRGTRS
jgi:hypothetical protein